MTPQTSPQLTHQTLPTSPPSRHAILPSLTAPTTLAFYMFLNVPRLLVPNTDSTATRRQAPFWAWDAAVTHTHKIPAFNILALHSSGEDR